MDIPDAGVDEGTGVFAKVASGDVIGVQAILSEGSVSVNCVDEHGMTPLEHAAYRGNKDMCQLLLDCVNNHYY